MLATRRRSHHRGVIDVKFMFIIKKKNRIESGPQQLFERRKKICEHTHIKRNDKIFLSGIRLNLNSKINFKKTNTKQIRPTVVGEKLSSWDGIGYVVVLFIPKALIGIKKSKNHGFGKTCKVLISVVFFYFIVVQVIRISTKTNPTYRQICFFLKMSSKSFENLEDIF